LEELKKLGDPIAERHREADFRPKAERDFRTGAQLLLNQALSTEAKYAHIPEEDKEKVVKDINAKLSWLDGKMAKQSQLPKYESPVVFSRDIELELQSLTARVRPVLNKPPPPPPKEEPKPEETPASETPASEPKPEESTEAKKEETTMDLD
jgi:heat shock protein 4